MQLEAPQSGNNVASPLAQHANPLRKTFLQQRGHHFIHTQFLCGCRVRQRVQQFARQLAGKRHQPCGLIEFALLLAIRPLWVRVTIL